MPNILTVRTICSRIFDEIVKEWIKEHYIIVSASKKKRGKGKVLKRKAHLRKRTNSLS